MKLILLVALVALTGCEDPVATQCRAKGGELHQLVFDGSPVVDEGGKPMMACYAK